MCRRQMEVQDFDDFILGAEVDVWPEAIQNVHRDSQASDASNTTEHN